MKNKLLSFLALIALDLIPFSFASAQSGVGCSIQSLPKLANYFKFATCILGQSVLPLIFAIAIAMFVWGVVQYVIGADEEKERAKGKQFMIWGIVALAVMVSVWGLVKILTNTFGFQGNYIPRVR